jgi:hypothetical protein
VLFAAARGLRGSAVWPLTGARRLAGRKLGLHLVRDCDEVVGKRGGWDGGTCWGVCPLTPQKRWRILQTDGSLIPQRIDCTRVYTCVLAVVLAGQSRLMFSVPARIWPVVSCRGIT